MDKSDLAYPMDKSDLAYLMLKWEEDSIDLVNLAARIKTAVLQQGQTVVAGNVRATYRKGRKSYDYEAAAAVRDDVISPAKWEEVRLTHTQTITTTKTDWRGLCTGLSVSAQDIPFTESEPSVSLKLEE